ncbi:GNAT family N-acetyltransferase [Evansella halocellulosilytica]|uniref:GNAT family N-acetyltransferase n=1 Tax=Evansella halocellulosilytica TaxID=2011013 RepID=UPI000BB8CB6F|nr:GNAT family N-acetyltransferase [Evansella halocellulosilytica]
MDKSIISNLNFSPMTRKEAETISTWQYPAPYDLYSMDGSEETINEFINYDYYMVKNEDGNLIGYVCFGEAARVPGGYEIALYNDEIPVDIGLGIHPDLTGKRYGTAFLTSALTFLKELKAPPEARLVVTTFNKRAIRLYEKVGFKRGDHFFSPVGNHNVEFVSMRCPLLSFK